MGRRLDRPQNVCRAYLHRRAGGRRRLRLEAASTRTGGYGDVVRLDIRQQSLSDGRYETMSGTRSVWTATLVMLLVALVGGCRSQKSPHGPAIEFTRIPPAAQGGRERTDVISGRVVGAAPA